MIKRSLEIAMAFVGVLVGASFASGREALQYYVAFGNWGILGAVLVSLGTMAAGAFILQLGSYHRAKDHTSVFEAISGPITSKILDGATMTTLFCIGFAMFAGAGANLEQQFGWNVYVGAIIMLILVLLTGLLDVDKVTIAIGAATPLIIVLITLATLYTIFTSHPDYSLLNEKATALPTTLPNWWISAINSVGLQVIVVVSMAIVIGGSFLDSREAGIGGIVGGFVFLFLLAVLVASLYISVDTVTDTQLPTLAMITKIHPALGYFMTLGIFGMIYNTAVSMFYALAKRLTRKNRKNFYKVYCTTVIIGFILSFIGFSNLIGWVYPVLGYLGILVMAIIFIAWWRNRSNLETESELRRRARELLTKSVSDRASLTRDDIKELHSIAYNSNIPERDFIYEILREVDIDEDSAEAGEIIKEATPAIAAADLEVDPATSGEPDAGATTKA